ncbi:MAG: Crp/Fnr family transcriptional regulator [Bacteroidota bacterium]
MIDALINYCNKHFPLSREERDFLKQHIPVRRVGKQKNLLSEGEVSTEFFFLIEGCIRLFYEVDSEEKTAFFYTEGEFVSSYESYTRQTPARHFLQTIEACTLAVISVELADQMLAEFPTFAHLARLAMEEELIIYQDILATFITLSPEQRYRNLLARKPELAQRVPQYLLASYLGVAPETLSRIRNRMRED